MFNRDSAALNPTNALGKVVCISAFHLEFSCSSKYFFWTSTALLLGHNLFHFCKPCRKTMAEVGHLRKMIMKLEQKKMQSWQFKDAKYYRILLPPLGLSGHTCFFFSTSFNPQTFAFCELPSLKKSSRHYDMSYIYNHNEQKKVELCHPKIKLTI